MTNRGQPVALFVKCTFLPARCGTLEYPVHHQLDKIMAQCVTKMSAEMTPEPGSLSPLTSASFEEI